jgi:hypothetical protein
MGMDDATLKDLAFKCRSSREVHVVDRRVCLSGASYAAAEKSGIWMALKIFWERSHSHLLLLVNQESGDASWGLLDIFL